MGDPYGIGTDPYPGLEISPETVAREIEDSPEVRDSLERLGVQVADYAKSIAPVFSPDTSHRKEPPPGREVGEYRDSIHNIWVSTSRGVHQRVISEDMLAAWIEYGTEHMPEYAVFARTAAAFGGDGPVYHESLIEAQQRVHAEREELDRARREGRSGHEILVQQKKLDQARIGRSAVFRDVRQRASRAGRQARS